MTVDGMKLIVGDLSTWSIRAWMCLRMAELPFEEIVIPLGSPGYQKKLAQYSETLLVPVLDAGEVKIHDSLAIAEYCNELSGGRLFPDDRSKRAVCRGLCSELHSGFAAIRSRCPFTWHAEPVGDLTPIKAELRRLEQIWSCAESNYYFSEPTAVDAFYAVLAYRLSSYGVEFPGSAGRYQKQVLAWLLLGEAIAKARSWSGLSTTDGA